MELTTSINMTLFSHSDEIIDRTMFDQKACDLVSCVIQIFALRIKNKFLRYYFNFMTSQKMWKLRRTFSTIKNGEIELWREDLNFYRENSWIWTFYSKKQRDMSFDGEVWTFYRENKLRYIGTFCSENCRRIGMVLNNLVSNINFTILKA